MTTYSTGGSTTHCVSRRGTIAWNYTHLQVDGGVVGFTGLVSFITITLFDTAPSVRITVSASTRSDDGQPTIDAPLNRITFVGSTDNLSPRRRTFVGAFISKLFLRNFLFFVNLAPIFHSPYMCIKHIFWGLTPFLGPSSIRLLICCFMKLFTQKFIIIMCAQKLSICQWLSTH